MAFNRFLAPDPAVGQIVALFIMAIAIFTAGTVLGALALLPGAVLGAVTGVARLPADAVATVVAVNRLELKPLVDGLLALRDRSDRQDPS